MSRVEGIMWRVKSRGSRVKIRGSNEKVEGQMKKSRVASISKIQAFILTFIFIIGKN